MLSQGSRIREERERLGLKQDQMGVAPPTQRYYESDKRSPDCIYLARFAELGADILYVVTGQRSSQALTSDQQQLLAAYRVAGPTLRAAALAVLTSGAAPSNGAQLNFEGNVGAAVAGDATFNAPVTAKKARKK